MSERGNCTRCGGELYESKSDEVPPLLVCLASREGHGVLALCKPCAAFFDESMRRLGFLWKRTLPEQVTATELREVATAIEERATRLGGAAS